MCEMLTPKEAGIRLCMPVEEVRKRLRDGRLRGTKVKNRWRVDEREIERYLSESGEPVEDGSGPIAQALFRVLGGTRPRN